jgi:hypothetical protein
VMNVELHDGEIAVAEREVREDYAFLESAGETYVLSSMAALLSRVVRDQGRDQEALVFSKSSEQASAAEDVEAQALWRSIRAPILARAGDTGLAEELARMALQFALRAESPSLQADVLSELAHVLRLCGKTDEARKAISEAVSLYASKGDIVAASSASKWANELDADESPPK